MWLHLTIFAVSYSDAIITDSIGRKLTPNAATERKQERMGKKVKRKQKPTLEMIIMHLWDHTTYEHLEEHKKKATKKKLFSM